MSEVRVVLHDCLPLNSAVASHSRPEHFSDATAEGSQSEGSIRTLDTSFGAKRKFKFNEYLDFMLCSSVGLFFFFKQNNLYYFYNWDIIFKKHNSKKLLWENCLVELPNMEWSRAAPKSGKLLSTSSQTLSSHVNLFLVPFLKRPKTILVIPLKSPKPAGDSFSRYVEVSPYFWLNQD